MTIGLTADEFDPLDSHRRLMQAAASRASDYATMIVMCLDMRDDAGADAMRRSMIAETTKLQHHAKLLYAGLARQPSDDATKYFDRLPVDGVP